jgi:hypothetical protein
MMTNNQKSPMPHIIPGIISFIMVHLTRLARNALRDVSTDLRRQELAVLPIAIRPQPYCGSGNVCGPGRQCLGRRRSRFIWPWSAAPVLHAHERHHKCAPG